jgi:hypothetical protein
MEILLGYQQFIYKERSKRFKVMAARKLSRSSTNTNAETRANEILPPDHPGSLFPPLPLLLCVELEGLDAEV